MDEESPELEPLPPDPLLVPCELDELESESLPAEDPEESLPESFDALPREAESDRESLR